MTLAVKLLWWHIPTALTVLALLAWWFLTPSETGMFAGLGAVLALIPTLIFLVVVWIVAAIPK